MSIHMYITKVRDNHSDLYVAVINQSIGLIIDDKIVGFNPHTLLYNPFRPCQKYKRDNLKNISFNGNFMLSRFFQNFTVDSV